MAIPFLFEDETRRRQNEAEVFGFLGQRIRDKGRRERDASLFEILGQRIADQHRRTREQVSQAPLTELQVTRPPSLEYLGATAMPSQAAPEPGSLAWRRAEGIGIPAVPTTGTFPWTESGQEHQEKLFLTLHEQHPDWTEEQLIEAVGRFTSPLGAQLAMAYPLYGAIPARILPRLIAGEIVGGLAGHGLEKLGVPVADTPVGRWGPMGIGQAVGMMAGPAVLPSLERAAVRGVTQLPTVARAGITGVERRLPGLRRLVTEEVGGPKLKPPAPKPAAGVEGKLPPPTHVARPRPTGEVVPPEPPKPPKPPKVEGPPPEEPSGELLARFLEGHHDVGAAKADWAKFQGGLALRGKQIDLWMKEGSNRVKIPTGGKRTPEMEQLYKALHGEGKPPAKYQAVYDEVEPFMREQERRLLADVPEFEQRMLKDPTYFTRKWRNWEVFEDIAREAKGEPTRGPARPGRVVGVPGKIPKVIPRRTLPRTFSEALEVGGEPLTWNPYEMAAIHAAELEEYRFTQVLIQAWRVQGRVLPRSAAPRSWETPPYKAFEAKPYVRQPKVVEGVTEESARMGWSEPVTVSPEDAKMLPHILGYGFEGAENALAYTTSVFKRAKVLFGLFQYWDLQGRTLLRALSQTAKLAAKGDLAGAAAEARVVPAALKAWGGAFFPPIRNKLWRQLLSDPEIAMAIEEGGMPIGGLDVWKRTMRSSLEPDLVMRAPIIGDIPAHRLPAGLRQSVQGTQKVMNGMYRYIASGLYDSAHPQYWSSFYKSILRELRTKYPQLTERQVAAIAAKETNILMSSIPDWHSVLNPRLRQLGRGIGFSVNEGEAWGRMIPRAITGKNPEIYRQQWAAYLFGTLAFAEVINYAMTGELLSPDQLSPIVMRDGKPIYNSKFARPRLDGDGPIGSRLKIAAPLGRHIYLDLMGQADTPFRMLNPQFFVMTRLSPQLSVFIQLLQGKRYFGQQELEGLPSKALFTAEQLLAPIPLVGFGQERERIGNVGAIIQATGWNVSSERLGDLFARQYKEETGRDWDKATVVQRREDIAAHPELQEIRAERLEAGLKYESPYAERTAYMTNLKEQQKGAIKEALRVDPTGRKAAEMIKDSKGDRAKAWDLLTEQLGIVDKPRDDRLMPDYYADEYLAIEADADDSGYVTPEEWDRYDSERQAVLVAAQAAGVAASYISERAKTVWDDPELDELERLYARAKESMREYSKIPRFRGVSSQLAERASAILRQAQAMAATQGIPLRQAIAMVGRDDPEAALVAAMESRLGNPARSVFWKAHPELSVFWGYGAPAYLES